MALVKTEVTSVTWVLVSYIWYLYEGRGLGPKGRHLERERQQRDRGGDKDQV